MTRNWIQLGICAALVLMVGSAPAGAKQPPVKNHDVQMIWTAWKQDVNGPSGPIEDWYDVGGGGAFVGGHGIAIMTTPRALAGEDIKSGKWRLETGPPRDYCEGKFLIEETFLDAVPDQWEAYRYDGTLRLSDCFGRFSRAPSGPFADIKGRIVCQVGSCAGGLRIDGSIKY